MRLAYTRRIDLYHVQPLNFLTTEVFIVSLFFLQYSFPAARAIRMIPAIKRYIHQLSAIRYSLVAYTVMVNRDIDEAVNQVFDLSIIEIISIVSITDIEKIVFAAVSKYRVSKRSAIADMINMASEDIFEAFLNSLQINLQAMPTRTITAIFILLETAFDSGTR